MISPGDRIVILGDSWGCGEWSAKSDPYRVTHRGLELYLNECGCNVTNLSKAGGSNKEMVEVLHRTLHIYDPKFIFWFQTDPMRDLRPYNQATFPKSISEVIELSGQLLNDTYADLNRLGVKIHCMGGTSKLQKSIENYPNLIPLIPSIIEMFGGPEIDFWISDWINADDLRFSDEFLQELENHPQHILPKEWFFPDGVHANREAHRKIFELILNRHK